MTKALDLKSDLLNTWQEWKHIFTACLLINLLAYGLYIVYVTYAVDDYDYIFLPSNAIVSGRWVIDFIHNIVCRTSLMPTVLPVFCMALNVLTGIGICKLWSVRGATRFMAVTLWSIHPYLLDMYNFRLVAFPFSIGYFLMLAALCVRTRGKVGYTLSIILIYLALSIYQPVLGLGIAVIMMQILLISFRNQFSAASIQECAKLFGRYMLLIGVSVIVYLAITKLIFMFSDVEASSRLQAGFISDLDQVQAKVGAVLSVLIVRLGPVKEFVLPFGGKLGIFIIYLTAIFVIVKKPSRLWTKLAVLLWIGLIPLGAIVFSLPLEALSLPWRVCMGLVVFFAGMYALTQESESLLIRRIGITVAAFLVIYFILNNNTILYKQHLTNQQDLIMGNRIIAKIQSLEGYQPGMELAIVGKIKKEDFSREGKSKMEIIREYVKYCSVRRYSLAKSAFETDWSKYSFLLKYMDLELKRCGLANFKKAIAFSQGRKPWPDPSSVFVQDDIVVVILSHEGI